MEIIVAKKILNANDQIAQANRARFDASRVLAVNLLGSPGAGKTTLLEAVLPGLAKTRKIAVVEGDLATSRDAERIEAIGVPSMQINTAGGCHLDANMVSRAIGTFELDSLDLVVIENVGNLVCTAGFDLGEHLRVVVLSVTEGDDKIEKYPPMFQKADALVLSKMDLLPHTNFQVERMRENLQRLSSQARLFPLSVQTGDGIDAFVDWLESAMRRDRRDR
ncbi:hydrogenase nickel incorporation protein HypB [Candidatus Sumerlaeota bacterium]|nr:hydrogenase nickel incorporation protein HypB [Candidatus Sumerlaeota bacterium]